MKKSNRFSIKIFLISLVAALALFTFSLIFFAPRLVMLAAQNRFTSVEIITDEGKAPLNSISHTHRYPTSEDRIIVRPNADTFYSSGWYDLKAEPWVLHVPEINDRYYSFQINDVWTNAFAYVGLRATGTSSGDYAIVGPGWKGSIPEGVVRIDAPTRIVWIIGRTMVYGPDDQPNVAALQEKMTLVPISAFSQ